MLRKCGYRPRLEALEDRWAPAIAIFNSINPNTLGLDLNIQSIPGLTTNAILIDSVPVDTVNVFEDFGFGFVFLGSFSLTDDLLVNLTTFPGSMNAGGIGLQVHLFGGEEIEGNVLIQMPNALGGHSVGVGDFGGGGGIIGNPPFSNGNLTVTSGTGNDIVAVGFSFFGGPAPINISGSVNINPNGGNDIVDFWGGDIGGNVTVTNANQSTTGIVAPVTIEGNLLYVNSLDTTNVINNFTLLSGSTVQGNADLTTGIRNDNITIAGDIEGTLTAKLGAGINSFVLAGSGVLHNNLSLLGGSKRDVFNFDAASIILGDVSINLGSSGSTAPNANVLNLTGTIMGTSIAVTGGNGRDEVIFDATAVGGNLLVALNGGADRFTLGPSALFASADLDGGSGTDVFVNLLGLIEAPFALRRFP